MHRTIATIIVLLTACTFQSEGTGLPDTSSSSSDGSSGPPTSTIGEPPRTDGPATTDDVSSTSSDGSDSSNAESSSGSTVPDVSSSGAASSESTGEPYVSYSYCSVDDISACPNDEICIWQLEPQTVGWCAQPCNEPGECPQPDSGNATTACTYYGPLPLRCMLRCENGETCPFGMLCQEMLDTPLYGNQYGWICVWPDQ